MNNNICPGCSKAATRTGDWSHVPDGVTKHFCTRCKVAWRANDVSVLCTDFGECTAESRKPTQDELDIYPSFNSSIINLTLSQK